MYGLTVRWPLTDAGEEVAAELRSYVTGTSLDRFSDMPGLCWKTWQMRAGEWFEGSYVWETADARDAFLAGFREQAPTSLVTKTIGAPPEVMEPFEVVAVAEGEAGFAAGPGPGLG